MGHVGRVVMAGVHVGDGGAIADHIAIEVPCIAQVVLQKHGVSARGRTVNRVIGAHHRLGMRLSYGRTKRRK